MSLFVSKKQKNKFDGDESILLEVERSDPRKNYDPTTKILLLQPIVQQ